MVGLPGAGHRAEARAGRREARSARARPQHHARLLARRRADARPRSTRRATTGSATRCASSIRPIRRRGCIFDGRLAEDFKLSTGTWVSVGPLRARILAAAGGLAQDVVIAGPDREFVARADLSQPGRVPRSVAGDAGADAPAGDVLAHPRVAHAFQQRARRAGAREHRQLDVRRARHRCSTSRRRSMRARSPTRDRSTRRPCCSNRAALVEELYAPTPIVRA